ncbi:MAG: glutamyl-tRNA reductase [Halobacteriaceae archaeon]
MTGTGLIAGVRVSHDCAGLDAIEAAATGHEDARAALLDRPEVEEAFVLGTCHRFEAYVVADDEATGAEALADQFDFGDDAVSMDHEESIRHLLRVAAGLESVVLGEDQILGQVRDAHAEAKSAGALGPLLDDALAKAVRVGERARTETAINEGVVSMGSAAVRLVRRERDLAGATALVVGAGEMGSLAAKAFARTDVADLLVANRTLERARHLVADLDCESTAVPLEELPVHLRAADVVVTATGSPDPVVGRETVAAAGETVVVDLARPADVAPSAAALETVDAYDIDDLEAVTERTRERRREAAEQVERIVDAEFDLLLDAYKRKRADEVVAAMYEGAEHLKQRELDTAVSRLEAHGDLTEEQRQVVESLADALVSQLLAAPTESIREAAAADDWRTIDTALRLFDPGSDFDLEMPEVLDAPERTPASADAGDDD